MLYLDLPTGGFLQVTLLKRHLHHELPPVKVGSVELSDAPVDFVVHEEGVIDALGRVCEAWAHKLLKKALDVDDEMKGDYI